MVLVASLLLPALAAAQASSLQAALPPTVAPQTLHHFHLLENALARYEALALQPALTTLPRLPARSVKPGEKYAGTTALRTLLTALGDLPAATAMATADAEADAARTETVDDVLDAELVTALQRFQERHGLEADGVLGRATWEALTTPLSQRVRQIRWTLERWRALPPNPHRRALFINIPRFRLYGFPQMTSTEPDLLQIDVVVGRAVEAMRTPVFAADLTHVIFQPYWEVPESIARNELLPLARGDAEYMDRHHFEILDASGQLLANTPAALDAVEAGTARIRQRPGDDNALGAVKFVLPNPYDIYLHDTPARELFTRTRRAYSHGCIRVGDPVALAQFVLEDDPQWTAERIAQAMQSEKPLRVDLREPIRVYIVYGTAIAREDGSLLFLQDIYGMERKAPPRTSAR